MEEHEKSDELTIADRIGFAFIGMIMALVLGMLLLWLPYIAFVRSAMEWAGILVLILAPLVKYYWLLIFGAGILGFATGDKYLTYVLDPLMDLFNWVAGHVKRD